MAYNGVFPATYTPYYQTYQQPFQTPVQATQTPYQAQYQQPQQPSSRTVEVYPVANEKAVYDFPSSAGTTQMFIANDDTFVAVKEVSVTGQVNVILYDKRPPAPAEKPVDMGIYVTHEELDERLAALSAPAKRSAKKEDAE